MSEVNQTSVAESDATKSASRNVESPCGKPQFSCLGCGVVAVIVFFVIGLLLPSIGAPREAGRRAACLNKMRQLGLATRNYASSHNNSYPPSAGVVETSPNGNKIGGYSFLVRLLPYMDYDALYKSLPRELPRGDLDPALSANPALATAMNTSLKELVCPSNNNRVFQDETSSPPKFAFTNYKAVGASTRNSLIMAGNPAAAPPYGSAKIHPDGAVYPSAGDLPFTAIVDGTSHTIFLMETTDDQASRWMIGAECTLVGLPKASSPTGAQPSGDFLFFAPPGFDNTFGDASAATDAGLRTFLIYDFSPAGDNAGSYEDPSWSKPPAYGPSSALPSVTIAGFGDGSVTALSKRCDAANLFFLITKANNDPFNLP